MLLFEQPWRVAGGKVASPPATLDAGFAAAGGTLRTRTPLVVGGRSAGARSAARTATALGAAGCLALAFPLHPPGRPEKSRLDELRRRRGADARRAGRERRVRAGPRSSRRTSTWPSYLRPTTASRPAKRSGVSEDDAMAVVVEATLEWIVREVTGNAELRLRESLTVA